jgi:hypothetical protein
LATFFLFFCWENNSFLQKRKEKGALNNLHGPKSSELLKVFSLFHFKSSSQPIISPAR